MQTAKETREARRRKLLERGSDRLAFIAGELKSLPREPQVHQETPSVPQRSVPLVESEELVSSAAVISAADNETNRDHTPAERNDILYHRPSSAPQPFVPLGESELVSSASVCSAADNETSAADNETRRDHTSADKLSTDVADVSTGVMIHPRPRRSSTFTLHKLAQAIDATEIVRIVCAASIALYFVLCRVLSYNNRVCILLERFMPLWPFPFLMVVVTNITLVISVMVVAALRANERDGLDVTCSGSWPKGLMSVLGNAWEGISLVGKIANAMSTDFCIYSVVLVCSMSLGQYFS